MEKSIAEEAEIQSSLIIIMIIMYQIFPWGSILILTMVATILIYHLLISGLFDRDRYNMKQLSDASITVFVTDAFLQHP